MSPGIAWGVTAFLLWGGYPIYWKCLRHVPVFEVLSHRVFWSALLLTGILLAQRRASLLWAIVTDPKGLARLISLALLIVANWGIYVWAVDAGHILDTSLGYFITPLFTILLGVVVLRERLSSLQWVAVVLAMGSVATLAIGQGSRPWISLGVATSLSVYALFRKIFRVESLISLAGQTWILAPFGLAYLGWLARDGRGAFGHVDLRTDVLLIGAGIVTASPLYCLGHAVERLPLSAFAFLQYIAPSLQFLCAVFLYREPFGRVQMLSFGLIWLASGLLIVESVARRRAQWKIWSEFGWGYFSRRAWRRPRLSPPFGPRTNRSLYSSWSLTSFGRIISRGLPNVFFLRAGRAPKSADSNI